jgi:hypothetical protein
MAAASFGAEAAEQAKPGHAEKVFKAYGEFLVGGTWKRTDEQGNKLEHAYRWILNERFVQGSMPKDPNPHISILGVDPETGKATTWQFFASGIYAKGVVTMRRPGEWVIEGKGVMPEGPISGKYVSTKVNGNELQVKGSWTDPKGEEHPIDVVWKRKK